MIEYFDYKNEKSFRDNYVKPMREIGFITMTIPDKPIDPENKYVITEKGKSFLTGQFSSDRKFHELKT
jgi:ATP-dependent DNA helicase RecG